jgi:hypothetical protein
MRTKLGVLAMLLTVGMGLAPASIQGQEVPPADPVWPLPLYQDRVIREKWSRVPLPTSYLLYDGQKASKVFPTEGTTVDLAQAIEIFHGLADPECRPIENLFEPPPPPVPLYSF